MKPGRELDALVAEKVMGLAKAVEDEKEFNRLVSKSDGNLTVETIKAAKIRLDYEPHMGHMFGGFSFYPKYSTDIAAAWEVIEHIQKTQIRNVFSLFSPTDESNSWFAVFEKKWHGHSLENFYDWPNGESAPHAICLSALRVIKELQ